MIGATLMILTACAPTTKLATEWEAPQKPESFEKIVAIAMSRDNIIRRIAENEFVNTLPKHAKATEGLASYSVIPDAERDDAGKRERQWQRDQLPDSIRDLVLSDQPIPPGLNITAYNHRLGESGMSFFALRSEARRYRGKFPDSLQDAPMLLPSPNSALRRRLDDWFEKLEVSPRIVGEFDDSALLKAFGEAGAGLFAAQAGCPFAAD